MVKDKGTPTPLEGTAALLEKILHAIEAGNETLTEILATGQDTNSKVNDLLTVSNDSNELLQSVAKSNVKGVQIAQQNLEVSEAILASSHRIEELLGGTGPAVPTDISVTYKYNLERKSKNATESS
jgi:methyl-accepting chemotaxis protein